MRKTEAAISMRTCRSRTSAASQGAFVDISYIRTKVRITKSEISMRTWRSPMSAALQGAFVDISYIRTKVCITKSEISMHTCRSRMSDALQGAFVDIPEISLCDISGIIRKYGSVVNANRIARIISLLHYILPTPPLQYLFSFS